MGVYIYGVRKRSPIISSLGESTGTVKIYRTEYLGLIQDLGLPWLEKQVATVERVWSSHCGNPLCITGMDRPVEGAEVMEARRVVMDDIENQGWVIGHMRKRTNGTWVVDPTDFEYEEDWGDATELVNGEYVRIGMRHTRARDMTSEYKDWLLRGNEFVD